MQSIGRTEIIIVAVVVLLLFGGSKIPAFIRGLGLGVKEYKEAKKDEDNQEE